MPSYLIPVILTAVTLLTAACLALPLVSPDLSPRSRYRAALAGGAVVALWLPAMMALTFAGAFQASVSDVVATPPAIFGPVLLFGLALALSPALRQVADGLDQRALIALQGLRVVGAVFVLLWLGGYMPWQFAVPAGFGDIGVGLLALYALKRSQAAPETADLWAGRVAAAGILDFAVAIGTGLATSPGPLQVMAFDAPNALVWAFPLALIPVFCVPLFLIGHLLSIRLMLRHQGQESPAKL